MLRVISVIAFWSLASAAALAQPAPIRWGSVSDADLTMTHFAADPEAQAVVLADYATAEVDRDGRVQTVRHRRIKLLSEGGYDFGTVSIVFTATDRLESVDNVRGQTFFRDERGRTQRAQMGRDAIFTEDLSGGRRRMTFTLPALQPGAVIEYTYRIQSNSPLLVPDWAFQDREPVLHSEFRLEHPATLAYAFVTLNAPRFSVESEDRGVRSTGNTRIRRWVAENVPALRPEAYMPALEDYRQRLAIQLTEYMDPRIGRVEILNTWEALARTLRESPNFGTLLRAPRNARPMVQAATEGLTEPEARARAIYQLVRSTVVWDGRHDVFPSGDLARVLERRQGSAADVNALLVALLRDAGLEAEPVLLSTRGHGRIIKLFPLVTQFNHTAAAVRLGGTWTLLDATDPHRPFGMMPAVALNGEAWLPAQSPAWLRIPGGASTEHYHFDAKLVDGALEGALRVELDGYAALDAHRLLAEGAATRLLERTLDDSAIEIRDAEATVPDGDGAVVLTATVRLPGMTQSVGDLTLLGAQPLFREVENPFKMAERTYPVDFSYPASIRVVTTIELPPGLLIDEMPTDLVVPLPDRAGIVERKISADGSTLTIVAERNIRNTIVEPRSYESLKRAFDRIVAAHGDRIVLRAGLPGAVTAGDEDEAEG